MKGQWKTGKRSEFDVVARLTFKPVLASSGQSSLHLLVQWTFADTRCVDGGNSNAKSSQTETSGRNKLINGAHVTGANTEVRTTASNELSALGPGRPSSSCQDDKKRQGRVPESIAVPLAGEKSH